MEVRAGVISLCAKRAIERGNVDSKLTVLGIYILFVYSLSADLAVCCHMLGQSDADDDCWITVLNNCCRNNRRC
jgi:hypothetical protein